MPSIMQSRKGSGPALFSYHRWFISWKLDWKTIHFLTRWGSSHIQIFLKKCCLFKVSLASYGPCWICTNFVLCSIVLKSVNTLLISLDACVFGHTPLRIGGPIEAKSVLAGPAGSITTERCEPMAPGAVAPSQTQSCSRYLLSPWIHFCLRGVTLYYPHKRTQQPAPPQPGLALPRAGLAFPTAVTPTLPFHLCSHIHIPTTFSFSPF